MIIKSQRVKVPTVNLGDELLLKRLYHYRNILRLSLSLLTFISSFLQDDWLNKIWLHYADFLPRQKFFLHLSNTLCDNLRKQPKGPDTDSLTQQVWKFSLTQ
jgi:hypothetical protein